MELYDPALSVAYFYAAGDEGVELLWQVVQPLPPGKRSHPRRRRFGTDGAGIVQVTLEREGRWGISAWQELAEEMERWLGTAWDNPPGRPWGSSRIYLAGSVTGLHEEPQLLREALALSEMPSRPMAPLPTGRLWLGIPPAMTAEGNSAATYVWLHSPREGSRQEAEALWWGEKALLLRVELYLHRALHILRQYGPRERTDFWAYLEEVETGLSMEENALRRACQTTARRAALLNRRHNLLRSSTYLYRQIAIELCQYEGSLFSWYEKRLNEALTQWGYDLERADRSIALARTVLQVQAERPAGPCPPVEESAALPASPPSTDKPPMATRQPALPWPAYLAIAALVALCLVDENYLIIAARATFLLVLSLALWVYTRFHRRSP